MRCLIITILFFTFLSVDAQKFVSQQGTITFFSDAPVEDITAVNKTPVSLIDFKTGDIVFLVKVREFNFDKALMQEHFKEKYMEADKYPKSEFKGKFSGFDPKKSGNQEVSAEGLLTIHGITKPVTAKGLMARQGNLVLLKSEVKVLLKDYNISVPQILWQNIAEEILVTIEFIYRPYEN